VASNASVIDVSRLLSSLFDIVQKMSKALLSLSILAILSGLLMVVSMTTNQVKAKINEAKLVYWIGCSLKSIRNIFQLEFLIMGFFSVLLGNVMAFLTTMTIGHFVFQANWWSFQSSLLLSLVGVCSLVYGVGLVSQKRLLKDSALRSKV